MSTNDGVRSGHEQKIASVKAVRALLELIVQGRDDVPLPTGLTDSLRSQGALAGFCSEEHGIVSMSLNTFKTIANELYGSFDKVDAWRTAAFAALQQKAQSEDGPAPQTKLWLQQRLAEAEGDIQTLLEDLGLVTNAFARLAGFTQSLARELGDDAQVRWRKELQSIEAGLSLLSKPTVSNVIEAEFGARR